MHASRARRVTQQFPCQLGESHTERHNPGTTQLPPRFTVRFSPVPPGRTSKAGIGSSTIGEFSAWRPLSQRCMQRGEMVHV